MKSGKSNLLLRMAQLFTCTAIVPRFITQKTILSRNRSTAGISAEYLSAKILSDDNKNIILLDDAQFLNNEELDLIANAHPTKIIVCFGLKYTYKQQIFPAFLRLLDMGAIYMPINPNIICQIDKCNNVAKWDARMVNHEDLFLIDKDMYMSVCDKCYFCDEE